MAELSHVACSFLPWVAGALEWRSGVAEERMSEKKEKKDAPLHLRSYSKVYIVCEHTWLWYTGQLFHPFMKILYKLSQAWATFGSRKYLLSLSEKHFLQFILNGSIN